MIVSLLEKMCFYHGYNFVNQNTERGVKKSKMRYTLFKNLCKFSNTHYFCLSIFNLDMDHFRDENVYISVISDIPEPIITCII